MLKTKEKISVICYHNIATNEEINQLPNERKQLFVAKEQFDLQMKFLKMLGYKTLTLDEFYNWKKEKCQLPKKSILITFDDGRMNVYKYAMPILKKYDLKATIFVIGNQINNTISNTSNHITGYITKDIINKCKNEYPNIEFASHSYDLHHKGSVTTKNIEELKQDLDKYQKVMGKTKYFAYPYGDYTKEMIMALKEKKYKLAFIYAKPKRATKECEDFLVPRINMSYNQKNYKFILKIILPFIY